jgi:hypothetical protein
MTPSRRRATTRTSAAAGPETATGATETVDASPSKTLFIDMLVRDIELRAAVGDLADNSVDGARRALGNAAERDAAFRGFYLEIDVAADHIEFRDNCGGISLKDAREYAFKFGRPKNKGRLSHSIGQFGVGMKRAFFKLGRTIHLESATPTSRFKLHLPVAEWEQDDSNWNFVLHDVVEGRRQPKDRVGTRIRITHLLPAVAAEVGEARFPHDLLDELAQLHSKAIAEGFRLEVNGIQAHSRTFTLLGGGGIVPAYDEYEHNGSGAPVRVRIACGIAESEPGTAGWDVVCNGRTVLKSDQTPVTGWRAGGDVFIPSYHNQFARFRGIVLMDSTDASRVPWSTTKTHLNQDSEVWREAKRRMILLMRPVIDFLNALDREKDQEAADTSGPTLAAAVGKTKPVPLRSLQATAAFKFPTPSRAPRSGRVTFYRPRAVLDRAKSYLGVATYREVGESAFDYWLDSELGDE